MRHFYENFKHCDDTTWKAISQNFTAIPKCHFLFLPFSCSIDKPIAAAQQAPKVKSLQEELLEAEEEHKKESLSLAIPTSKGNTFSIAHCSVR